MRWGSTWTIDVSLAKSIDGALQRSILAPDARENDEKLQLSASRGKGTARARTCAMNKALCLTLAWTRTVLYILSLNNRKSM